MTNIIEVEIQGVSPLLMHKFPMMEIEGLQKMSPERQAEHAAYRDVETNQLFIPGVALQRCLVAGATYQKGKGRSTLQKPVAACLFITPPKLLLGAEKFEIDSQPVVIPATKGRIIRHRPRLDKWSAKFSLEYDETLLTDTQVRAVVDSSGSRVGILDFRPEKKGPFGRFMVTLWDNGEKV